MQEVAIHIDARTQRCRIQGCREQGCTIQRCNDVSLHPRISVSLHLCILHLLHPCILQRCISASEKSVTTIKLFLSFNVLISQTNAMQKFSCLIFLLISLSLNASAQNKSDKQLLDSLRKNDEFMRMLDSLD